MGERYNALRSSWRAMAVGVQEPPLSRLVLGTAGAALAGGVFLAVALFALAALLRHGRALAHDLSHLLGGAAPWQGGAVVVLMVIAPPCFSLGIACTLAVWLVIFAPYFELRERYTAMASLALLALISLALPAIGSHLGYPGSRAQDMYESARDAGAEQAAQRLAEASELDGDELWVLGMRARWAGRLAEARDQLTRAAEKSPETELWVSLGSVRYLDGDMGGAVGAYEQALGADSEHVGALFNLWRAYSAMAELQKANQANQRARAVDYDRVESLTEEAKRSTRPFIVEGQLPARLLTRPFVLGLGYYSAVQQAWAMLGGPVPRRAFSLGAGLAVLVVFLLGWLGALVHVSRRCPRCGRPACRRCASEMPDQAQCGECYSALVSKTNVDPQLRIKKEIEGHRHRARRAGTRHALAVMLAGAAQMSRGAADKGLALAAAFWTVALLLAFSLGYLQPLATTDTGLGTPVSVGLCVLLAVIYGLSLVDGVREEH